MPPLNAFVARLLYHDAGDDGAPTGFDGFFLTGDSSGFL